MPAAMHSFYLRSLYMRNELAQGELELAGEQLSLADVKKDVRGWRDQRPHRALEVVL